MAKPIQAYGVTQQRDIQNESDRMAEEVQLQGYSVCTNVLSEAELALCREKLDAVYALQEQEFGREHLAAINELNVARALCVYDEFFLRTLAANPKVLAFAARMLGSYFVLHLQNGIINRPGEAHHQSSWHRDLPYQNFVSSKPLSLNALFCIDPYTIETGCTWVVPFSHRNEYVPSDEYIEKNKQPLIAPAGSVVFFDSMLFHAAGYNSSSIIRRAINNVYVAGIIRQQIDLPSALGGKYADDPMLSRLLGYDAQTPQSVNEFRKRRLSRNTGTQLES
jgi:ectoine hydroxylase-related dioxygenase (phytanoyl-CoA dioxygenase family)